MIYSIENCNNQPIVKYFRSFLSSNEENDLLSFYLIIRQYIYVNNCTKDSYFLSDDAIMSLLDGLFSYKNNQTIQAYVHTIIKVNSEKIIFSDDLIDYLMKDYQKIPAEIKQIVDNKNRIIKDRKDYINNFINKNTSSNIIKVEMDILTTKYELNKINNSMSSTDSVIIQYKNAVYIIIIIILTKYRRLK